MAFDKSSLTFETLALHHNREGFDFGKAPLNDFLKKVARQNADRNIGVTTVVVPEPGSSQILGYYTLVVRTVLRETLPTALPGARRLPEGEIGVARCWDDSLPTGRRRGRESANSCSCAPSAKWSARPAKSASTP